MRFDKSRWLLHASTCAVFAICSIECFAQTQTKVVTSPSPESEIGSTRFISFAEASGAVRAISADLPEELVQVVAAGDSTEWDRYVRSRDAQTRDRLHAGDLDTLANLLLFGTSYTSAAPLTPELLKTINASSAQNDAKDFGSQSLLRRIDELALALAHPANNERLEYFRHLLYEQHYRFETPDDIFKVKQFLGLNLIRMLHEDISYATALSEAQRLTSNGLEKRSQVFAQRGISLDTSLFPSFAIEEALAQAKRNGLLPSHISRVAVIGPGLDVVNKDQGWDYYPEQTTQPLLILDSLVRLGLADTRSIQITTLDISDLVNQHILSARARARKNAAYIVQLPLRSDIPWDTGTIQYWQRAGTAIGRTAAPIKGAKTANLKYKAMRFPPSDVLRIHPENLDVVYQRKIIPDSEKFDLVVATNVFVYYGAFEQALAMANLSSMLRGNGLLFTNDALPEQPGLPLRNIGFSETAYSPRPHDGDRVIFYAQASQSR